MLALPVQPPVLPAVASTAPVSLALLAQVLQAEPVPPVPPASFHQEEPKLVLLAMSHAQLVLLLLEPARPVLLATDLPLEFVLPVLETPSRPEELEPARVAPTAPLAEVLMEFVPLAVLGSH
jgi:hypothetical protein